ncbi:MAG: NlpC/P60 family protein [Bacteroidales bacterium]|nr:NlpC/P60 family protein [Bacteroidales bacterium]
MKKRIMLAIASVFFCGASAICSPANSAAIAPMPVDQELLLTFGENPLEELNDYEKYEKKLGTKFKGTEDLNFLKEVASWLGTPYKYGASNKGKGTDCSGFVGGAYKNAYNIKLNRTSSSMVLDVNKVDRNELECGDLLFFANDKGSIYHVAIYLANDVFIHSATSKNIGVKTESLNLGYYKEHFYCAGRVKSLDKRGSNPQEKKEEPKEIVNGTNKNDKKVTVEKSYSAYSNDFGVEFKGNEDLNILKELSDWMGTPYKSGQSERGVGCDCPGLVQGVFKNACKISLNRDPEKLMKNLKKTTKAKLKFGDIVFYKKGNNYPIIGIYLGNSKMVYTSVSKGVMLIDINTIKSYNMHFCGSVPALNY